MESRCKLGLMESEGQQGKLGFSTTSHLELHDARYVYCGNASLPRAQFEKEGHLLLGAFVGCNRIGTMLREYEAIAPNHTRVIELREHVENKYRDACAFLEVLWMEFWSASTIIFNFTS